MKRVINITLGSVVFAIEQDAYDTLAQYLESVKNQLGNNDDAIEIVADIEAALAEKFIMKKRNEKQAVTSIDVLEVIKEMGTPESFADEIDMLDESVSRSARGTETKKRLYRDTDNAVIAGVASGLASYFNIDPVVVRIIFFISIFFNGLGLFAYTILWLVVPKAQTTVEKYAMRGEAVTLKEITHRVKKNIAQSEGINKEKISGIWASVRPIFERLFSILGLIVQGVIKVTRVFGGIVLLVGGAIAFAGLVSAYSIILLSEKTLLPPEAQTAVDILISNKLGILAMAASFVMMMIPLFVSILVGSSLLTKRNLFTVGKSIAFAVVWIVSIVLAITASALQLEQVFQELGIDEYENENYQIHINVNNDNVEFDAVVTTPIEEDVPSLPPAIELVPLPPAKPVFCTMDAKECADGSYVGRTGPNCEFATCPGN